MSSCLPCVHEGLKGQQAGHRSHPPAVCAGRALGWLSFCCCEPCNVLYRWLGAATCGQQCAYCKARPLICPSNPSCSAAHAQVTPGAPKAFALGYRTRCMLYVISAKLDSCGLESTQDVHEAGLLGLGPSAVVRVRCPKRRQSDPLSYDTIAGTFICISMHKKLLLPELWTGQFSGSC